MEDCWIVTKKMTDSTTLHELLILDVYCSSSKKHTKRSVFPVGRALFQSQLYVKEEGKNRQPEALLYFFKKKSKPRSSSLKDLYIFVVEKILVKNLFRKDLETEFEVMKSVDVGKYGTTSIFNPASLDAEMVIYGKLFKDDYHFLDGEMNYVYRLDHPATENQLEPGNLRWVGQGRCCIAGKNEKSFKIVDLRQKTTTEIELGEENRFFENTTFKMIYTTKNVVLFCEISTNISGEKLLVSDRLKIVDFRSKCRGEVNE